MTEDPGFGTAELMPDAGHPGCWTLIVDGVAQSYVDLDDPRHLKYSYVRRVASVVDAAAPAGRPLRVLHLGGGALTIARYVAVTRPGSAQLVVERDGDLDALVRRMLPLPRGADVRTIVGDAREAVADLPGEPFDLIITDAYDGAQMPARVASLEFTRMAAGVLTPGGTYVVNVADLPPALFTRIQSAALREVFPDVCAIGEPGMFRGRRYGNIVLVAGAAVPVTRLGRIAARDELRAKVLHGEDLDRFIGGVAPMRDAS